MKSIVSTSLFLSLLLFNSTGFAQDVSDVNPFYLNVPSDAQPLKFTDKLFKKLNEKANYLNNRLERQSKKYMANLLKQEHRLRKKIAVKDSALATLLFNDADSSYTKLLRSPPSVSKYARFYNGKLDSINTALGFLQKKGLTDRPELKNVFKNYTDLQDKLNHSEQITKYISQRKELFRKHLSELGMLKELKTFSKQLSYYNSQIAQYKSILNEPSKIEGILLNFAKDIPAFKDFFAKYSQLGSIFSLPVSEGAPAIISPGLQTRQMVNQLVSNQLGNGRSINQVLQESAGAAQNELQQLQNKLKQLSSGKSGNGSDEEMPDYTINSERAKPLLKRVFISAGIQSQKSYSILPVTSDINLSLNYNLTPNKIMGLGIGGKVGWGRDWRHLNVSLQGYNVRSFVDVRLKGSFWLSGGYEMNYRPDLNILDTLNNHSRNINPWQRSGVLGISKIVNLKNKTLKKTKIQVLWDFLSYSQIPRPPAILWRVEYAFK